MSFARPAALAAAALVAAALRADPPADADMVGPFPHPKGYVCARATGPVAVDGKLSDPAWDAAPWSDPFVDIEGDAKPRQRHRTRMKMLWDDEALYIAAELDEPHVWATLRNHDDIIFLDNDFEVFLDPDGDNHVYGELELNALNTTWDLLLTKPYKDGGKALHAWEILGLKTAVSIDGTLNDPRDTDRGWTLEVRWPWAGLKELTSVKLPPRDGDRWRINFSRVEWDTTVVDGKYVKVKDRPEQNWVWSPQGVIDMHRPERWGYLQFTTATPAPAFRPDPDWAVRDMLHRALYSQRVYHKANGRYAAAAGDLKLGEAAGAIRVETTRSWFEMSAPGTATDGKARRYTVTSDGQLRTE